MMNSGRNGWRLRRHRGVALIVAIVCVSIAVAVMAGLVQLAIHAYREVDLETRRAQARWLMESAVDRAAAQLAADVEYSGEAWSLAAEDLGGTRDAKVQIAVERVEAEPNWRVIRVVADYPRDLSLRVRQTREVRIQVRP